MDLRAPSGMQDALRDIYSGQKVYLGAKNALKTIPKDT